MSKVQSRGERHTTSLISGNDESIFGRNESLRLIVRRAFSEHGAEACKADADLSTRLSEAILCVIEQAGTNDGAVRRRAQLFATRRLLAISEPGRPVSDCWGEFLTEALGPEWTSRVTLDDFKAVGPINTAVEKLLVQPQWCAVHDGHVAMSCMSILSLYDVSFLNWRTPQKITP